MKKPVLALCFGLVLTFALSESMLFLASRVFDGGDRGRLAQVLPKREGALRILCVGDSNTYGTGVERSESYPAQLEALLNAGARTHGFEVVNLGVPGSNSAQVLNRLPHYLERLDPDLLIITVGVNDIWNFAEVENDLGFLARLRNSALRLRSVKLVFLLVETARDRASRGSESDADLLTEVELSSNQEVVRRWRLQQGDRPFIFEHAEREQQLEEAPHRALLEQNLERIFGVAETAFVPVVLATYASNLGPYGVANRGMTQAGQANGKLVVQQTFHPELLKYFSADVIAGDRKGLFQSDLHPKAPVYRAAAMHLHETLVAEGGYLSQ